MLALAAPAWAGGLAPTSLYERLGGFYGVAALVDDFVDRLLTNETIVANPQVVAAFDRPGVNTLGLKAHITNMLCQAAGGPERYTGRSMEKCHEGLKITAAEWEAALQEFGTTLETLQIAEPERQELRKLVGGMRYRIVGR